MAKVFGETSTTDEVLSGVNLKGKRVLVTGVSSGLGVETARSLAAHGAQVVGAARDLKKADAATDQVRKDAAANGGSFEVIALDLASLTSVRACADALLKKGEPFDVIIANAGVMATPFGHTEDGLETQFGTNHLGHFVLVNTDCAASSTRRTADQPRIRRPPLRQRRSSRPQLRAHSLRPMGCLRPLEDSQHPFCSCVRLARHRDRGIRAAAVHPGGIQTELARHLDPAQLQATIDRISKESTAARGQPFSKKTIPQGAATSVWAGFVASAEEIGGQYCENCHVSHIVPEDKLLTTNSEGVRAYALDRKTAEALWRKSEELVGEHF